MDKPPSSAANKPPTKPAYISSSGHVLESPPFSARLSRFSSDVYNFLGLYFVSLFSLDPYAAAQNSQFNTRGRPSAQQARSMWGGGVGGGSGRLGSGGGAASGGSGSGGARGGGGSGRRMGGIDDVRAPECGSCG
ncbi:hypothetical protein A1O7_00308 [Cladophialophora yegresii CBS 114405]|uniref:Uncharacterized protein n=1 Tax=Cladophialophora yegresii CBS 114405 TaxID=1182544 RepID=W9W7N8_9EURO|nr:uncharacterized protein A1O7_00308 [Cladophialophora yegresii CBS 114405]EXJ63973.1 hypothetical protein A1O7_00308 [Cladophialophora yegresii CBS 114405]